MKVVPLLSGPKLSKAELRDKLNAYLSAQPEGTEIVADYPLDYMLLVEACGGSLPPNIQTCWMDISWDKDLDKFKEAMDGYFAKYPQHHAMHDARAMRLGYLAIMNRGADEY